MHYDVIILGSGQAGVPLATRLTASGHGRFVAEREIEVNGECHGAEVIVINTGARPAVPDVPGLASVPWLDNHKVMQLRTLPRRLLVLGGGYIACEFTQQLPARTAQSLPAPRPQQRTYQQRQHLALQHLGTRTIGVQARQGQQPVMRNDA